MSGRIDSADPLDLLPRELVLASAGTGKTHALSNRIIGLLAAGEEPEAILAATFTRKAAGEILNRVLVRLSVAVLDEEAGNRLAKEATLSPKARGRPPEWSEVLSRLLRHLHRVPIGTLDSFFIRVARSFAQDLFLSPDWAIADEPSADRCRSQALQEAFATGDRGQTVELVRMALRGETGRSLHRRLREDLEELRSLRSQLDPDSTDVWSPFSPEGDVGPEENLAGRGATLAARLEAAPMPLTAKGLPDKRFFQAMTSAVARVRGGDWEGFLSQGPPAKALDGTYRFAGKDIDPELRLVLDDAIAIARVELKKKYRRQLSALQRLAEGYERSLNHLQRESGSYRFEDLTRLLGGSDPVGSRPDLWYRLDQWTRHLLLDEFQDTSFAQWDAIRPLAEEILAGHAYERSLVLVADPKQSIYGWRGAEPDLVHRVRAASGLPTHTLSESYRSSSVVLGFVNRIFGAVAENIIWEGDSEAAAISESWGHDFLTHRAARDIPGYVRVTVGPREENMARSERPEMMAWVADQARAIHEAAPHCSMAILVRQNKTVARLTTELKGRGVEASEEGATALIDSPAAATLLALLHLSDHPGDTFARYQVSQSPLGGIIGLTSFRDAALANSVARGVRRRLLRDGYGKTLAEWARELGRTVALSTRDHQRLLHLVELGYRWEAQATLRPGDFVRFARAESMDTPSEAKVRVMTVHQAKGLEFDIALLPELDTPLYRRSGRYRTVLPERDPHSGRIVKIFPRISESLKPLFAPDMDEAFRQAREGSLRDALGVQYVAMTRARHALFLYLAADPGTRPPSPKMHPAWLVRAALGLEGRVLEEGEILVEEGDPDWHTDLPPNEVDRAPVGEVEPEQKIPVFRFKPGGKRRLLPHESPSEPVEPSRDALAWALRIPDREGTRIGRIVHLWLRELEWADEGLPGRETLVELASREAPTLPPKAIDDLISEFSIWMDWPQVRSALERGSYPPGSAVETEMSFATRVGGRILQGQMDRVVLTREGERVVRAVVLDYKTDRVERDAIRGLEERVAHHRPQMEGYRSAVARMFDTPLESVAGRLIFLRPGLVVDLDQV